MKKRGLACLFAIVLVSVWVPGLKINATEQAGLMAEQLDEVADQEEEILPEATIGNLTATYDAIREEILIRYTMSNCSYVKIYINGIAVEENYTGTAYPYDDIDDGKTYEIEVKPYNAKDVAGASACVSCTIPFKEAVLVYVDADYDLETKVLVVDWFVEDAAYVDVYQDGKLLAEKVTEDRLVLDTKLAPLSKHIYTVIPYNKNQEAGRQMSYELQVEDYVAEIGSYDIEYNEATKQLKMSWETLYTSYVDIYLNDVILAYHYTKKSFVYNVELQPGASYKIYIMPYNSNKEEGEELEEDISFGYFDVPECPEITVTSIALTNQAGNYTGFYKPAVKVSWDAQERAVYEIYRAEKNKKGSYSWLATVKPSKEGIYTYVDEKVGIGNYYYKIRRKIVEDAFTEQELYTNLSDDNDAAVKVSKPQLTTQLTETGHISLTMKCGRQYVSGYDIYRKGRTGGYYKIATTTEDEYVDAAVEFGQTYWYKVKAYYYDSVKKTKSEGKYSKVSKVINSVGEMQIKAVAVSKDRVRVMWTPAANAEAYEVYFRTGTPGDSYVLWTTTTELMVERQVTGSTKYFFNIKAYRMLNEGKSYFSSAEVSGKLGFTAPGGLEVAKTSYKKNPLTNEITQKDVLSWDRVHGAKGYYVDVYNPVTKKYVRIAKLKKSSNTSYTVFNVIKKDSPTLKYRISAYTKDRVRKGDTIEITPQLGKVKKVQAVKSGTKVKLKWKKVVGAERYQVFRSNGRTMQFVGETAALTFTDKGLSPGVNFKYYVQAVNYQWSLVGISSDPISYIALPAKVTKLTAVNVDAGSTQLLWNAGNDVQKYIIYYKTAPEGEYLKLAEVSNKNTSYIHKNVAVGMTYYYQVTALHYNGGGLPVESEPSGVKILIQK